MPERIGDVLAAQHRHVLELLDDLGSRRARGQLIQRVATAVLTHLAVEEQLLGRLAGAVSVVALHHEEHASVRSAVERLWLPGTLAQRNARTRVLRALLIHHAEPEERVVLPRLEVELGRPRSLRWGRVAAKAFAEKLRDVP
jgi:hypothetical protein